MTCLCSSVPPFMVDPFTFVQYVRSRCLQRFCESSFPLAAVGALLMLLTPCGVVLRYMQNYAAIVDAAVW